MLYIGIDLGTSSVKILLMEENIRCLFQSRAGRNRIRPTGTPRQWMA